MANRRRRSPAVYRRRRLAVLIVLIAVLALGTWLVIAQPWANAATQPAPSPTPTEASLPPAAEELPSAEPSAEPGTEPSAEPGTEPSAEPGVDPSASEAPGAGPCHAQDVSVEAVTDAETYPAGSMPGFSILLTNESSGSCTIDVGSATQIFTVTSGKDMWWDSRHCQAEPSSMVVTLEAGQSVSNKAPVVWDRTRSDAGTCDQENRPRAPGGGSSYHLAVSIGGFDSAVTRQFFLY